MEYLTFIGQATLSIILGGAIGWQRHHIGKAAGVRTFALMSVGSTLFTILSLNVFIVDPARVASQILTGVGFIGAGIIFHKKNTVDGLTTAAAFWSVAAIGMAVGAEWYIHAVIVTIFMFLILITRNK
jgi:putative Mg2+ transporter-C (MgtC) family protein